MPLSWPRKSDAWDGSADVVRFPGEDGDTLYLVGCAISQEALAEHFGGERGDVPSLLGAFRRYRAVIERVASDKYDAEGRPDEVTLRAQDFLESRGGGPLPGQIGPDLPGRGRRPQH
jgi:hypothetical protein